LYCAPVHGDCRIAQVYLYEKDFGACFAATQIQLAGMFSVVDELCKTFARGTV
jgi:hypothetical protein